jgi:hypothetical protein
METPEMVGLGQNDEATLIMSHFYVNFDADFEFDDSWIFIRPRNDKKQLRGFLMIALLVYTFFLFGFGVGDAVDILSSLTLMSNVGDEGKWMHIILLDLSQELL